MTSPVRYRPGEKAQCPHCQRVVGVVNPHTVVYTRKVGPTEYPGSVRHVCQRCNGVFDLIVRAESLAA